MVYKAPHDTQTPTPSPPQLRSLPGSDVHLPDHKTLIEAIADHQDSPAFIALFNHFAPRIKSYLMKSGTPAPLADDLAQETMLSVWAKAGSYNPAKAAPSTWIFTIARNKKIDAFRKINPSVDLYPEDTDTLEDTTPKPDENTNHTEETHIIAVAIDALPEDQALLLKQAFFEGKTHAQIAEDTGLPLGTIKSRIRLGLEKLRDKPDVRTLL